MRAWRWDRPVSLGHPIAVILLVAFGTAHAGALSVAPVAAAATAAPAAAVTPASAAAFEAHWQDGRAEVSGYRYTVTRYGEPRAGSAVLVYVTEPFSATKRVKVDRPDGNRRDTFEALKLNLVRDLQTGIYDYNTMASLFVRSRDFTPVKITFSASEWCGHVYEEMLYERHHVAVRRASYFEDESGLNRLTLSKNGIAEEELFVRLRDLRQEWLRPGERRKVPFVAAAFYRRLTHSPLRWGEAEIERSRGSRTVTVPAGRFDAVVYTVRVPGSREGTFWIEGAYPHRVLRWEWKATARPRVSGRMSGPEALDSGEMTGSVRIPYWRLNRPGDERYLRELGLPLGAPPAAWIRPDRGSGSERGGGKAR